MLNLEKALQSLKKACAAPITEDRDKAGIIKNFEFVYELSGKSMKRKLEDEGQQTRSPREVIQKAFEFDYVKDESLWLQIIQDRNLAVHTYNQDLADQLVDHIKTSYLIEFIRLFDFLMAGK